MTISKRRASTVFDRFNFTILDFTHLSDPSPVHYEPEDFFQFYDVIFAINLTQTNWQMSTQFTFLLSLSAFLEYGQDNQIESLEGARQQKLQEFLAAPIAIYNDAWLRKITNEDMGNSLALAILDWTGRCFIALSRRTHNDGRVPVQSRPFRDYIDDRNESRIGVSSNRDT